MRASARTRGSATHHRRTRASPAPAPSREPDVIKAQIDKAVGPKTVGKIDLEASRKDPYRKAAGPKHRRADRPDAPNGRSTGPEGCRPLSHRHQRETPAATAPAAPVASARRHGTAAPTEPETIRVNVAKLAGLKTVGKIELPVERERKPSERATTNAVVASAS